MTTRSFFDARRVGATRFAWLAFALAMSTTTLASAQPIHEHALRITAAAELGNGRIRLLPQDDQKAPDATDGFLLGARVGLDVGFNRRLAFETALAAHWYTNQSLALLELHGAPRIRFIRAEHDEWYIRPLIGGALVGVNHTNIAFVAGLGVGYRRQLGESTDIFFEVGYRLRWMRRVEAGFASRVFDGFTSTDSPNGIACFLGLTAGVGFGL